MKTINLYLFAIAILFGLTGLKAQTYEATLTGSQAVLPVSTTASGSVSATLTGNVLVVSGSFDGLSSEVDTSIAGGAHLHIGYAGENGPVEIPLNASYDQDLMGGSFLAASNTFTLSASQVEALDDHQLYVNIHTQNHPSGELRGQLLPPADEVYMAHLFGSNQVPSILSGGSGAVMIERTGNDIRLSGSFMNLSSDVLTNLAGGSHIHLGFAGENGPVIIPLNISFAGSLQSGTFNPDSNEHTLTSQQLQSLNERQLYVNIHTANYNSGELRGQITGVAQQYFRAYLTGANQVPGRLSTASGQVIGEWNEGELIISGSLGGLSSEIDTTIAGGGHIHAAPAGRNGGVIIPLGLDVTANGTGATLSAGSNTYNTTAPQDSLINNRGTYVNIHTTDNPAGATRGQLLGEAQAYFKAYTAGINEVPPVLSRGYGVVNFELLGSTFTASGSFDDLGSDLNTGIAGGGHIHTGMAGENGGVLTPLNITVGNDDRSGLIEAADNKFTADSQLVAGLVNRGLYVNFHSMEHAGGELRGQILPEAPAYFNAPLSGTAQPAPVQTFASGNVVGEWKDGLLTLSGTFSGIDSQVDTSIAGGGHIHEAIAGSNGGVIQPLSLSFDGSLNEGALLPALNTYSLDSMQAITLATRGYYINIHSHDHPGGEIRGQLMPKAQAYFTTTFSGMNEVDPVSSPGGGGLHAELRGDELVLTGSFANLSAEVDTSILGGAHLHSGGIDGNGSVSIPINGSFANDLMSGEFLAIDNTFTLDNMALDDLFSEGLYANIHSANYGGGELRGQLLKAGNNFPGMPSITSPSDGAMITVSSQSSLILTVNWDMVTDTNGNALTYIWELASDTALTMPLISTNIGDNGTAAVPYNVLDSLLNAAGVDEGDTVALQHRVAASDGSVQNWSSILSLVVARDESIGIDDKPETSIRVYPNPAETSVAVKIRTDEVLREPLIIMNMNGQVVYKRDLNAASGTLLHHVALDQFNSGMYLMQIGKGSDAVTRKLVVE